MAAEGGVAAGVSAGADASGFTVAEVFTGFPGASAACCAMNSAASARVAKATPCGTSTRLPVSPAIRSARSVDRVNEGVHLARQAGDAMQQIQNGTREVADMVNDISSALHEQSVSSADIAKNVETIAQLSDSLPPLVKTN